MTNPLVTIAAVFAILASSTSRSHAADKADTALEGTPIRGGLCVIIGATDTSLAERMVRDGSFLVHVLCPTEAQAEAARAALMDKRVYGRVSVEAWAQPSLPYVDNLVSLLVVLDPGTVGREELLRVLRPDGEMLVKEGERFVSTVKPRIAGTDEWTHWRHGPDRNAVSQDKLVDVPRRVQWLFTSAAVGERSHVLLTKGRAFAQDRETLIARDAFNGLPLWKANLQKGNAFDWEYAVKVAALIVAKDERVYALTDDGRLKALDAATGNPVLVYDQAGVPWDILLVEDGRSKLGTLVLAGQDSIRALDAETGRLLWQEQCDWPHNTITSTETVFYIVGSDRRGKMEGEIIARELITGRLLWRKTYYWARRTDLGAFGYDRLFYEMRSPHNWRDFYEKHPEEKEQDRYGLVIIDAKTGEELQKLKVGSSARHGEFRTGFWRHAQLVTEAFAKEGLSIAIYDLDRWEKPASLFRANDVGDRGFGHCYPPVLTDRWYINGQLNFTDLDTQQYVSNQITRGACNTARSGYLPGNGMIYTFPKHCLCFPMLDGNVCLAPADSRPPEESHPLVHGSAWPAPSAGELADDRFPRPVGAETQPAPQPTAGETSGDWPTFRHDEFRSAGTREAVGVQLSERWKVQVPGPDYADPLAAEWLDNPYTAGAISAPVVAGGLVFVAQADTHRLIALDARDGLQRWQFVASGRLDGPPTIHRGQCLIGCRDGWVYNVRAADGQLIWKLRIAPHDRRISVYGQLESPWPVAGSVLVVEGLGYVSAGLHPQADGGVRVVCFRPETGQIVWQQPFTDLGFASPWPDPYEPRKTRPDSDPWRCVRPLEYRHFDLPVRDGDSIAVSRCLFDRKTGAQDLRKASGFYQIPETGAYLPRTAWRYNDTRMRSPIAVAGGSAVYSTIPGTSKLFRVDFRTEQAFNTDWVQVPLEDDRAGLANATAKLAQAGSRWTVITAANRAHFHRAMLVAGRHLFIAAPNGQLLVYDTETGQQVNEMKLPQAAWDGLAAAHGCLYVSTADGQVVCLAPPHDSPKR